jgi:hypothetical protein
LSVINFPRRGREPTVIEFAIEIGSVDAARRTLECVEATVAVGLNLVDKTDAAEQVILHGLQRLFKAFATLVARERGVEADCQREVPIEDHRDDGTPLFRCGGVIKRKPSNGDDPGAA